MSSRPLKFFGALTSLLLVVVIGACSSGEPSGSTESGEQVVYNGDYPFYENVQKLNDKADLVVEATISETSRVEEMAPSAAGSDPKSNPQQGTGQEQGQSGKSLVVTIFQVNITKTFKGDAKSGQTIDVKQLGGEHEGKTYKEAGGVPLKKSATYILFLETYTDSPASLLNPTQGQYPVDATSGEPAALADNPVKFSIAELTALNQ